MSDEKKPNGRKYTLVKVGLAMMGADMAVCLGLAYLGKLTAEYVAASTVRTGAITGLIAAFQGANAYVTGQAMKAGLTEGGPG